MRVLLLLAVLCGGGCTGQLVAALEERNVSSCIWWQSPFGGRGITATGTATIDRCLSVPCPCALR